MNLQPWDYWAPDKTTPKGRTAEQVAALERAAAQPRPSGRHPPLHPHRRGLDHARARGALRRPAERPDARCRTPRAHAGAHLLPGRPLPRLARRSTSRRSRPTRRCSPRASRSLSTATATTRTTCTSSWSRRAWRATAPTRSRPPRSWAADPERDRARDPGRRRSSRRPTSPTRSSARPRRCWPCPIPATDLPFVQGSWRYARAMAQIGAGDSQPPAEEGAPGRARRGSRLQRAHAWLVPAKEVLTIAAQVVDGQIARAGGRPCEGRGGLARGGGDPGRACPTWSRPTGTIRSGRPWAPCCWRPARPTRRSRSSRPA